MIDNRILFTGKEKIYHENRPNYPKELLDYLYEKVGFNADSVIADIGSGTGLFSKQLLERGSRVICVEPNSDMRQISISYLREYEKAVIIDGDCEHTKIDSASVDFITVAQAFHWFNIDNFRIESNRILKAEVNQL